MAKAVPYAKFGEVFYGKQQKHRHKVGWSVKLKQEADSSEYGSCAPKVQLDVCHSPFGIQTSKSGTSKYLELSISDVTLQKFFDEKVDSQFRTWLQKNQPQLMEGMAEDLSMEYASILRHSDKWDPMLHLSIEERRSHTRVYHYNDQDKKKPIPGKLSDLTAHCDVLPIVFLSKISFSVDEKRGPSLRVHLVASDLLIFPKKAQARICRGEFDFVLEGVETPPTVNCVLSKDFDVKHLTFPKGKRNEKGSFDIWINNANVPGSTLKTGAKPRIQLEPSTTPFGIGEGFNGNGKVLSLNVTEDTQRIMESLDQRGIEVCTEQQEEMLPPETRRGGKLLTQDQVMFFQTPIVREPKNPQYSATIRFKVWEGRGEDDTRVWVMEGSEWKRGTSADVTPKSRVSAIISPIQMYAVGKQYGTVLIVTDVLVLSKSEAGGGKGQQRGEFDFQLEGVETPAAVNVVPHTSFSIRNIQFQKAKSNGDSDGLTFWVNDAEDPFRKNRVQLARCSLPFGVSDFSGKKSLCLDVSDPQLLQFFEQLDANVLSTSRQSM